MRTYAVLARVTFDDGSFCFADAHAYCAIPDWLWASVTDVRLVRVGGEEGRA